MVISNNFIAFCQILDFVRMEFFQFLKNSVIWNLSLLKFEHSIVAITLKFLKKFTELIMLFC